MRNQTIRAKSLTRINNERTGRHPIPVSPIRNGINGSYELQAKLSNWYPNYPREGKTKAKHVLKIEVKLSLMNLNLSPHLLNLQPYPLSFFRTALQERQDSIGQTYVKDCSLLDLEPQNPRTNYPTSTSAQTDGKGEARNSPSLSSAVAHSLTVIESALSGICLGALYKKGMRECLLRRAIKKCGLQRLYLV